MPAAGLGAGAAPSAPTTDLEHEVALLDVAAGMVLLRSLGFERIVLVGNSGVPACTPYIQQSLRAPGQRLAGHPGRPAGGTWPAPRCPADDLVLVSPHPGQGKLLMAGIDPR